MGPDPPRLDLRSGNAMRRPTVVRVLAVAVPLAITTVLWLLSKTRFETGWQVAPWQAASQITSLWALTLFAMVLLISARSRTIEKMYGGLDKSYHMHGTLAKVAFALVLVHPLLLVGHHWGSAADIWGLFVPGNFWPKNLGIASLYLFALLVALTLFRFMSYQRWLWLHKATGFAFVLGGVHALFAHSDIRDYEPLREWAVLLIVVGAGAWIYKAFLYRFVAQRYAYRVQEVKPLGAGIAELRLWPTAKRMNYEPGEFAFISFPGNEEVPAEHHPFSISSTPAQSGLRFSYKAVGDYTNRLALVKAGDRVEVFGPYGEFTSYMLYEFKHQIWIAGGIGITPFLSMLAYEARNEDVKTVWLFYSTNTATEAVYHAEIETEVAVARDNLHYVQHQRERDGLLTAEAVRGLVGDLSDYAVLMCGPPVMMRALKRQFVALGVPASRVFFEDFSFV